MAIITTVDECLKRDLLTWIGYSPNPRERACFPLPRFRDDGMTLTPIDPATFPDTGNITALIAGGQFSEEVASQFGNIVVARLNSTPGDNEDYRDGSNSNRYVAKLNLSYKRGTSQIEFSSFSSHPLSKRLLQVVEIGSKFDPAEPPSGKAALADADTIYTENFLVMAHGKTSSNLYGPFSFKSAGDGQVSGVFGLAEFDYRVYKFSKELTSAVLSLRDRDGFTQMDFVETAKIDAAIEEGRYIEEYDWIPRQQLVDALNRAVSLSDDAKGFG